VPEMPLSVLNKDYEKTKVTGLGNFDGLFCFLIEVDFPSIFDFRPDCRQRVMIPLVYFLSTYSLKVICELDSLNRIEDQLFKDRALLELIGFTGTHFEEGFSKRSKGKHLPFHITTMGKLFRDFSLAQTQDFFANSFKPLFENRFIPKGTYIADASPFYVSCNAANYDNTGVIRKDTENKRGYKLITLKYARENEEKDEAEIFVAAIVVTFNHHESP